jgi:hypothetical protein
MSSKLQPVRGFVIPAQAGILNDPQDPCFRRDNKGAHDV